ncbi:MAG: 3(2), 5-bisphosphate nucleotidase [Actinomycetota bacterium]|jgi:3'(2'), 5'-bisphosphate nucleotidase|nr:3(2), 5-bisphosphate nucleotidase [Actinomycetota bacterium]
MDDDHILAHRLAADAGLLLRELRRENPESAGREFGARGDRLSHELLMRELNKHRPEDAVLSEEGDGKPEEAASGRVWIVDPLDGTREYCEPGRSDWAVHVALCSGRRLVAGAVALPDRETVLSTVSPPPLPKSIGNAAGRLRIAISRSHRPPLVDELGRLLDAELVPMGSAGVKTAAVLTGEADAYVHTGGQYEWDSAAPVALADAAGAHTSRIDGSPLLYNNPTPYLPDLLVCRPSLRERLLRAIDEALMSGA